MATATLVEQRRANLQRAMDVDPDSAEWRDAALATLAGRGTRDALIALLGQNMDCLDSFAIATLYMEIENAEAAANRDCIAAMAIWNHGSDENRKMAFELVIRNAEWHIMSASITNMLGMDFPASDWMAGMSKLDLEACLGFDG